MSRTRSRSPPHKNADADPLDTPSLVAVRRELQHHVSQFNEREGLKFDRLIARYRRKTDEWAQAGHVADIFKHTMHVAAWFVFGNRTFGKTREAISEGIATLLLHMLAGSGNAVVPPRLATILHHVEEVAHNWAPLCEDSTHWATRCKVAARKAITEYDGVVLQGHSAEKKSSSSGTLSGYVKRGTWGRTDQTFVREVLGPERLAKLSPDVKIYWDGTKQRWYAKRGNSNVKGCNAFLKCFENSTAAIEHIASVLEI